MRKCLLFVLATCCSLLWIVGSADAASFFDSLESGGDRLVTMQQDDGGWDWPLDDGDPTDPSPKNTAAPIAMGLLAAYEHTGDVEYLNRAVKAGNFIKAESPPHSTGNGIFMGELSRVTGDASYADEVKTEFYGALAAGAYDRNGVTYDTGGYAQSILDLRTSQGLMNLGVWDVGLAAAGAAKLGVQQTELTVWQQAIETGLTGFWEGDYTKYQDSQSVIGLSGGIFGLSELGLGLSGELVSANYLNGAQTVEDLADILIGYQTDSGGFTMYADYPLDAYTGVQETAYAILALASVDPESYRDQIRAAANWLAGVQLASGGWAGGWAGSDPSRENNEVTGEALWAVGTAVPEPGTMLLFGVGLLSLARINRRKRQ